jgi:hypothetical protein
MNSLFAIVATLCMTGCAVKAAAGNSISRSNLNPPSQLKTPNKELKTLWFFLENPAAM